jgi:predicted PurR-regulated permease PerM
MDHPVIVTLLVIAVIASMSLASEVLKPLALSVLLSFALVPFARSLERIGLPRFPAAALTVLCALALLAGIGYVVGRQLTSLAHDLPQSQANIIKKIRSLQPTGESSWGRAVQAVQDLERELDKQKVEPNMPEVRVISESTLRERVQTAVGPYLQFLGVGGFVLILVLFMLVNRQALRDRITQAFGRRSLTLTTRTMEEVGNRISRYLAMLVTVNSCYGLVIGVGLAAIGVPYPVLWGFLAGALRFIPYVGPAVAFTLPMLISFARFQGWLPLLEVAVLFGALEVLVASVLEPVIYGRTTGVSALGLLVAAMFWTWLWGVIGLLLSTPLTVCMAVLGKYVPSLAIFSTLLGEDSDLPKDLRFYQRLLAVDQDGAAEVIEQALKETPRAEVFDDILVPALSRADRDYAREEIDEQERAFIWRVTGEILDEVEGVADQAPNSPTSDSAVMGPAGNGSASKSRCEVVGVPASDVADKLALRMLAQILVPSGCRLDILATDQSPLELADKIAEMEPRLVVLSHLPPIGRTSARYVVRRLRARFPQLPLLVGRWGITADKTTNPQALTALGASSVVFTLATARDEILRMLEAKSPEAPAPNMAHIERA